MASAAQPIPKFDLVIKPRSGWQPVDLGEVWRFRELLGFLVWRDIKVRYKQTFLGGLWAVIQPIIGTLVFGVLFTRIAPIKTDGSPYPLFVYAALVPWTFFANAITLSANSLIGSEQMIRKTYFPRLLVPLGAIFALGLDMFVSFLFFGILLAVYHWPLTVNALTMPLFVMGTFLTACGLGLTLSAMNVRYRDIKYVVPFFTQMAFFLTPIVYSLENAPPKLKMILSLNPMSGMIEGMRFAMLGSPVSWTVVWTSMISSLILFIVGLFYFRRMERTFSDVI